MTQNTNDRITKMWKDLQDGKVNILRDDKILVTVDNSNDAFKWILRNQSQSVFWACAYEGYSVENVKEWQKLVV